MKLRKLLSKDAPLMIEWMHDDSVVHYLRGNFTYKNEEDCIRFIEEAEDTSINIHMAIVNEIDEYMGTVSLKNIQCKAAEFAIVLRKCAMGKGYASYAMKEIMEYGHKICGIDNIYWCVNPDNGRAVQFYEKNNYRRCDPPDQAVDYTEEEKYRLLWYNVTM